MPSHKESVRGSESEDEDRALYCYNLSRIDCISPGSGSRRLLVDYLRTRKFYTPATTGVVSSSLILNILP